MGLELLLVRYLTLSLACGVVGSGTEEESIQGEVFYATGTSTSIFDAGSRIEAARPAPSNGT